MTNRSEIEIRLLGLEDGAAVARLAELDTAAVPPTPLIGGIVEGRLVAARSLASGESVADPFRRTSEIRSLLAQRARQLKGGRGRGLLSRIRRRLARDVTPRLSGAPRAPFVPGSEHTHLLRRSQGF
jgi:hypothetical protein